MEQARVLIFAKASASRAAGVGVLLALIVLAAAPAQADGERARADPDWAVRRFSVGLSIGHAWLEDSRRPGPNGLDNGNLATNFLGSLWGLDPIQSYVPHPFVEIRLFKGLAAGVAYDAQRARTLDWTDEDKVATAGDGDVQIRGLQAHASWRVRLSRRWTSSVSAGYAHYWSRFFVSPGWAAPGRSFTTENTAGWFAGLGCRLALKPHLGVEAELRHLHVSDVKAQAHLSARRLRAGAFPMRSDAVTVGLVFGF